MHTKNCKGNILIVSLILIVVVSGLVVVAANVTNHSALLTDRSRDFVSAQAAAEGAVDHAFSIWKRRINSQNRAISTTDANANLDAPTFTGYSYATAANDGPLKVEALDEYGAPEIFNTDQGSQFTSEAFTSRLQTAAVAISMDGRGRWLDNVFVERLWRTVKYDCIYVHEFDTVHALEAGLNIWFTWYNEARLHSSLHYQTPASIYCGLKSKNFGAKNSGEQTLRI